MTNTINENNVAEETSCCGNTTENSSCCGGNESEGSCKCADDAESCACGNDHDHEHDHEHHDHEHGDHVHTVTFENEDGTTEEYPIVDEFEIDGVVYVLVMNADETVTPLRVEGEEGELIFLSEEEFEAVSEAYSNLTEEDEEDDDDDDDEDSEVEPDLQ